MSVQIDLRTTAAADLAIVHAGMEQCRPGHAFGPAVRDYHLFHFVHSGKGCFQAAGQIHRILSGQGFMIFPDQVSYYEADIEEPWHYSWIAFAGRLAAAYVDRAGFTVQSPVTASLAPAEPRCLWTPADCFGQVHLALSLKQGREQRLLGLLYLFLGDLAARNPAVQTDASQIRRKEHYTQLAKDYMEMNYARKISIADLAAHIGLDRSYFGQLFRSCTSLTPQQYLLRLRIDNACRLMGQSDLAIGTIARSVGYEDPLLFSRMFRRVMGCSPTVYRHRQLNSFMFKKGEAI